MLASLLALAAWCASILPGSHALSALDFISNVRLLVPQPHADPVTDHDVTHHRLNSQKTAHGNTQDETPWDTLSLYGEVERPITTNDYDYDTKAPYLAQDGIFSEIPSSEFVLDSMQAIDSIEFKQRSSDKPKSSEYRELLNEYKQDSSQHRVVKKDLSANDGLDVYCRSCCVLHCLLKLQTSLVPGVSSSVSEESVPFVAVLPEPSRRGWQVLNANHPDKNLRQYVLIHKDGTLVV